MSERRSKKDTDGGASREPTPAYLRVQASRLLACADKLVDGFLSGVPKLSPLTALDTLEKMVRTVAALEDQARRIETGGGSAKSISITVNGIDITGLQFSPPADTSDGDSAADS